MREVNARFNNFTFLLLQKTKSITLMQSNVAINYLFLTKDVLFYLPMPATYSTNIKVAKELNWAKELPGSHGSSKYY